MRKGIILILTAGGWIHSFGMVAIGQTAPTSAYEPDSPLVDNDPYQLPILPPATEHWAGATVIAILGLFLAAAVIGPMVHANRPPHDLYSNPSPDTQLWPPAR